MKIDVYSDMVCPWCRIGKKNMEDAIERWNELSGETVDVAYHAYQLDPNLPTEGKPFKSVMESKFGGTDRLGPMLQRVTDAGAAIGVKFRFDQVERMPNTLLAHRVAAIVPIGLQLVWIDAVMKAYFEDGRDVASVDVLKAIAGEVGLDEAALWARIDAGGGLAETQKDFDMARGMGISGVPFFVIDGKYALSGAYPADQFVTAFRKISSESAAQG
jgi:predicted DsbA family dithiol-disulfide isomerase